MSDEVAPAPKQKMIALLLAFMLGPLGVHRFYLGRIGSGVIQLFTLGACGVWSTIDLIMIAMGKMTDADGNELV